MGLGGVGLRDEGNREGSGVCLTTGEVDHTSPQTHMPYFRPAVWGGAAHLWGQTGSHSRGCGSRGRRHAETERKRAISAWRSSHLQPPSSQHKHPSLHCSPQHDSRQSGSSGSAGTSDRVGANFCPKTSPSQLVVERTGNSRGRARRPTCFAPPPYALMPILSPSPSFPL